MINTTLFYVFIGISLILVWGYFYGRKKNNRIAHAAINSLIDLTQPSDQKITNIGGVVGYHVELEFQSGKRFSDIRATITLMARHSLLYWPISKLIRKFDRFFIRANLAKKNCSAEAHIIEKQFFKNKRQGKINSALTKKNYQIGDTEFYTFTKDKCDEQFLGKLLEKIKKEDRLKEVSIYPYNKKVEILIVPALKNNQKLLKPIIEMISKSD